MQNSEIREDGTIRVAITGGTGFVGRHLAALLGPRGRSWCRAAPGSRSTTSTRSPRPSAAATRRPLRRINREIERQTFQRVHVDGTRRRRGGQARRGAAARHAQLPARPPGAARPTTRRNGPRSARAVLGHPAHSSRGWSTARGPHGRPRRARRAHLAGVRDGRLPRADGAARPGRGRGRRAVAALQGRIPEPTVAVMGAEELTLGAAVRRIAAVAGRRPWFVPVPVWAIHAIARSPRRR